MKFGKLNILILVIFISSVFVVTSISGSVQNITIIPDWIKNNAKWWSSEQISDSEFIESLQYLIDNEILVISDEDMPALIITTDKKDYELGEPVAITLKNIGNTPLGFPHSNYGIEIYFHGEHICCGGFEGGKILEPKEKYTLVWEQKRSSDGPPIGPGRYEVSTSYIGGDRIHFEASKWINIVY